VGTSSEAEIFVLELEEPMDPTTAQEAVNAALPPGLRIIQAWTPPPRGRKFSVGELDQAEYAVEVRGPRDQIEELPRRCEAFMRQEKVVHSRVREGRIKEMDLRRFVQKLEVISADDRAARISMTLLITARGSTRPEELLQLLGVEGNEWDVRVRRSALYASGKTGKAARKKLARMLPALRRPPNRQTDYGAFSPRPDDRDSGEVDSARRGRRR
jgi:radical SAM-linked protein